MIFDAISGYDEKDSTTINKTFPPLHTKENTNESNDEKPLKGYVIGIPKEYRVEEQDEESLDNWNEG